MVAGRQQQPQRPARAERTRTLAMQSAQRRVLHVDMEIDCPLTYSYCRATDVRGRHPSAALATGDGSTLTPPSRASRGTGSNKRHREAAHSSYRSGAAADTPSSAAPASAPVRVRSGVEWSIASTSPTSYLDVPLRVGEREFGENLLYTMTNRGQPFIYHEYHRQGTSFTTRFSIAAHVVRCGHRIKRERARN